MKTGKDKELPSFWIPSLTPDAGPKLEEKPVSRGSQFEPRCEKICLRGFRQGPTQTGLCSHRRWLEA